MSQATENNNKGSLTLLPPTAKKIALNDSYAVRLEMSSVYRDMRSGKIEAADGTKLSYVLGMILKAHETCDLQKQLDSIKRELEKR